MLLRTRRGERTAEARTIDKLPGPSTDTALVRRLDATIRGPSYAARVEKLVYAHVPKPISRATTMYDTLPHRRSLPKGDH